MYVNNTNEALDNIQALEGLQRGARHDTYISAAGYIIGEYGHELKDVPAMEQFRLLHERFISSSSDTKVLTFVPNCLQAAWACCCSYKRRVC